MSAYAHAEIDTRVAVYLSAIDLLMVINKNFALHVIGTLTFWGDISSVNQFQTLLAERPYIRSVARTVNFEFLHGDLSVLLLKIENVVSGVIVILVKRL